MSDIYDVQDDGTVVLRLSVSPGAGRSAVVGRHGDALKVRVGAPPERGRANEAVVQLVASVVGAKPKDVTLVSGDTSRSKRVAVKGVEPDDIGRRLDDAIEDAGNASASDRVARRRTR
jgi:uncharacterized protein (TIGR00251 family)